MLDIHGELTSAEARQARQYLCRIFGCVIAFLFLIGVVIWATTAHASEVFRDKDDQGGPAVYRLSDKPCTHQKVLAQLYARVFDDRRFKAGVLTWHGKDWASCWVEVQGTVFSIDEEGSPFSPVLRRLFRDESI